MDKCILLNMVNIEILRSLNAVTNSIHETICLQSGAMGDSIDWNDLGNRVSKCIELPLTASGKHVMSDCTDKDTFCLKARDVADIIVGHGVLVCRALVRRVLKLNTGKSEAEI